MNIKKSDNNLMFAVLAVDVVCFRVIENKIYALIGKVSSENKFRDDWALIGGLIRPNETAEQSVDRLLKDKAGVEKVYKEQLYTFSEIDRDPRGRVVSVAYLAFFNDSSKLDLKNQKNPIEIDWVDINKIPKLGYDHNSVFKIALDRLKSKIFYTDIARYLLPKEFTFSDLQRVYELLLGESLDKRNFRKRINSMGMIYETGNTIKKGVMRPAGLYSFK